MRLLIAGSRPWNQRSFEAWPGRVRHETKYVGDPAELDVEAIRRWRPDYAFFVHWSWRIPESVYGFCECVGFHMTDLPFGRGGSPLQNLIGRGLSETRLSAFRIGPEMDAGAVYLKRPLGLAGRAQEIFERASDLAFAMIDEIVERRIAPTPQEGAPVFFTRRTPNQSRIEEMATLEELYDVIRMLDAEEYPHAFLEHGGFRMEFTDARIEGTALTARVRITRAEQERHT